MPILKPLDLQQFRPSSKLTSTPTQPLAPKVTSPQKASDIVASAPSPAPSGQNVVGGQMIDNKFQPTEVLPGQKDSYMKGGLLSKGFDYLMTPLFALGGYGKGLDTEVKKTVYEKYGGEGSKLGFGEFLSKIPKALTYIPEGIKNKISPFSKEQGNISTAGNFGLKGTAENVANFAGELAAPSLSVGMITKLISKIPGVSNLVTKGGVATERITQALRSSKIAPFIERLPGQQYFRSPEFGKVVGAAKDTTESRLSSLYNDLMDSARKLTSEDRVAIGKIIEELPGATTDPRLLELARPIKELTAKISKEAFDAGLLKEDTFAKYGGGKYMKHIFDNITKESSKFGGTMKQLPGISNQFSKFRKGVQGYIEDYAPAVFQGLGKSIKDVETSKMYKQIAEKFAVSSKSSKTLPEGYEMAYKTISNLTKSPVVAKDFKGMALPKHIIEYLTKTLETKKDSFYDKALNAWKAGKTIYNPGYFVRNALSNLILEDFSTGKGVLRSVGDQFKAFRSLKGTGDEFVDAARRSGLIGKTTLREGTQDFLDLAGKGGERNILQKTHQGLRSFQTGQEEVAKLSTFKTWVEKFAKEAKMTINEALQNTDILKKAKDKAEEAIFSPYRIGQQEKDIVSKFGIPFYSFVRQALPFTLKTAANNPERITKYEKLKRFVEGFSPEATKQEQGKRSGWAENQIRLPIKDKEGKSPYFDPTYIYPFGNFGDTGGEKGKLPFGLSMNPFLTEIFSQLNNRDSYYDKPITESNIPGVQFADRTKHAYRTLAPGAAVNLTDKLIPAFQGKVNEFTGKSRSAIQAILDVMGFKSSSYRPGEMRQKGEQEQINKLRSIQKEEERVMQRQDLSPQEKADYLRKLRKVYQTQ